MNLEHVRSFISLADCLNFTKAAEKEHMTQTSMSRRIRSLEEELGVSLFYRDNHQVMLTESGTEFYVQAQRLLAVYDASIQLVQNVEQGYARSIKIGVGIYEDQLLDEFLRQYVENHPAARITCLQYGYRELLKRFEQGLLDIIISSDQYFDRTSMEGMNQTLLCDRPWRLLLNEDNPLAARDEISTDMLQNELLVTMHEGSVTQIADRFRSALQFRDIIHVNSYNTKMMMVSANLGYGIAPAFLRLNKYDKICMRNLVPDYVSRRFYVLCHTDNPRWQVREFYEGYVAFMKGRYDG